MSVSNHLLRDNLQHGLFHWFYPYDGSVDPGFQHNHTGDSHLLRHSGSGNLVERDRDTLNVNFSGQFGSKSNFGNWSYIDGTDGPFFIHYAPLPSNSTSYVYPYYSRHFAPYFAFPVDGTIHNYGSGAGNVPIMVLFRGGNSGDEWYLQFGSGYQGIYTVAACFVRNDPSPIGDYANDGHDYISCGAGLPPPAGYDIVGVTGYTPISNVSIS